MYLYISNFILLILIEKERKRKNDSIIDLLLKCLQKPGLGQGRIRILPHGWLGSHLTWAISYLPGNILEKTWSLGPELGTWGISSNGSTAVPNTCNAVLVDSAIPLLCQPKVILLVAGIISGLCRETLLQMGPHKEDTWDHGTTGELWGRVMRELRIPGDQGGW